MTVTIEPVDWATRGEQLLRVRYAVFVDEQGVPPELEEDDHDADALHLLALDANGEPVGTARLLTDGHIGRMAVLSPWRQRGVGSALLRQLITIARARGLGRLFLNAQHQAETFYAQFGFVAEGGLFDDAGILHRRMVLQLQRGSDYS